MPPHRSLLPLIALAVAIAALGIAAWPAGQRGPAEDGRLQVVATTGMVADAVRVVGGPHVAVHGLMGPGVDPHLYKPSASDIAALDGAQAIFYGGLELEGRMSELFASIREQGTPAFAVTDGLPRDRLRSSPQIAGHYDPHVWFDVDLWTGAVREVAARLSELLPAHAPAFAASAGAYIAQLDALDREIAERLSAIPERGRVLVTAHDAFGYFGARYGVEVVGLQGASTASEASARDVRALADLIVERQVRAIFVESSVPLATIEAVQAACRARGWEVGVGGELFSDALGDAGTPEGTYLGMVRHNIDTIVAALAPAGGA